MDQDTMKTRKRPRRPGKAVSNYLLRIKSSDGIQWDKLRVKALDQGLTLRDLLVALLLAYQAGQIEIE
jgi:hypothetical protein